VPGPLQTAEAPARPGTSSEGRWREEMRSTFGHLQAEGLAGAPAVRTGPRGVVAKASLGRVTAFRVEGTPQVLRRTRGSIRLAGADPLKVCVVRAGRVTLRRESQADVVVGPGELALYDTGRPYTLVLEDAWRCAVMTLPRDDLVVPRRTLDAALSCGLPTTAGPGVVLTQLIETAVGDAVGPGTAAHLGDASVDLLAGLACGVADATAPDDTLRTAVLDYIRRHLGDPGLDVASVARAHNISPRTVHRLFEQEEWSVGQTIRSLRLDAVHADLTNPALAAKPIMAIASRWGFQDQAHLTRAFRARFGTTPARLRREAGGAV